MVDEITDKITDKITFKIHDRHQVEHELAMHPGGKEGHQHPGLYSEECCQQAKGADPSPLLSTGEKHL